MSQTGINKGGCLGKWTKKDTCVFTLKVLLLLLGKLGSKENISWCWNTAIYIHT